MEDHHLIKGVHVIANVHRAIRVQDVNLEIHACLIRMKFLLNILLILNKLFIYALKKVAWMAAHLITKVVLVFVSALKDILVQDVSQEIRACQIRKLQLMVDFMKNLILKRKN